MLESGSLKPHISRSQGNLKMPNMHAHEVYELYYLEAGSREYFVEDSLFSVEAGDFVLIAPGKLHRTGGAFGMRTLISFSEEYFMQTFAPAAAKRMLRCFERLKITPPEDKQPMFRQLLSRLFECSDSDDFAIILGLLLCELDKCEQAYMAQNPISEVVAYINGHFDTLCTIDQIAEQFYVSKYHLCRIFKNAMKMTVIEYLNQVRIRNACRYLRMSDMDMGQVAALCGFHDSAYFSNVFLRVMGQRPSAYRKNKE